MADRLVRITHTVVYNLDLAIGQFADGGVDPYPEADAIIHLKEWFREDTQYCDAENITLEFIEEE